jgi:hypothetical protein
MEMKIFPQLAARMQAECGWKVKKTQAVLPAYLEFLGEASKKSTPVPSPEIDNLWHNHILFLRDYLAFCQKNFGKIIFHEPSQAACNSCGGSVE